MNGNQNPSIGLYFHIPFCTQKCAYCHFFVLPDKDPFKKQLLEGFRLEWEQWLPSMLGKSISSIYFGGGTPALIGPSAVSEILERVKSSLPFSTPTIEITLEANPENITLELMQAYYAAGINRVSIGIQTFDEALLKTLQRLHTPNKAQKAVNITAEAGFDNISVDLMYDLPGQNLSMWENTLKKACKLPITHLSLYNLTIEPQTVFFKYRKSLSEQMPDPEESLQMYEKAIEILENNGLFQYEISAFAKKGFKAVHNVGYWLGKPFLGFGPSAFSYWEGKRFRNVANLNKYCKALAEGDSPIDFEEELDERAKRKELMAIQLRLLEGVNLNDFEEAHGTLDNETLSVLNDLQRQKLLKFENNRWALSKQGILFYDTVASEIV